ncbi:MAG TPA: hypothetical protein P5307_11345, partial [Pirellulaceae bacterium]|nr:hypothetical protein [Pirellulaceae bacterium]
MWDSRSDLLNDGRIQHFTLLRDDTPLAFADVLSLWRDDASFRSYFCTLLGASPFEAYRWEAPSVTLATLSRQFECVLLRSDALARAVDTTAFATHFNSESEVVTFPNLGGDAVMVVPCPIGDASIYGHLASFIRHAPQSQLHHLWQSVAIAMEHRVCDRPVWLSTAGMGVSWLHV